MSIQSYFLMSILIFVFSCNNNTKHNVDRNEKLTTDNLMNDSVSVRYDSLGIYSFKFNSNKAGDSLKSIIIYCANKELQNIGVNKFIEEKSFQLVDVNFDGFKDILVLNGSGSGGNTYWVWNYSTKDNTFHINNELSDRFGLEIDSVHKFIMFSYSGGFDVKSWDTFKYKNDKLFLLSSKHIDGKDTVIKRK